MNDFKGFRHGVKEFGSPLAASLLDVVSQYLSQTITEGDLSALELIELGAVYVKNERSLNPARHININDLIRIHTSPRRYRLDMNAKELVTQETSGALVVRKPLGIPLLPIVDNVSENFLFFLNESLRETLFPVNNIDADSSGFVLFAKDQLTCDRLKTQLQDGTLTRTFAVFTLASHALGDYDGLRITSCDEFRAQTSLITEGQEVWRISGKPLAVFYRLVVEVTTLRPLGIRDFFSSKNLPVIGDVAKGSSVELIDDEAKKTAFAMTLLSFGI